ncbi:MAG: prolyl oligopeptidase family serine peptidase, partial [Elusimicrobia bacterium]|nr:prolyl oligopeptidase family serine peptidase [Elusimicrobiota bacterium]
GPSCSRNCSSGADQPVIAPILLLGASLAAAALPDPYLWLETGDSARIQKWTAERDAEARAQLAARPGRARLRARLAALAASGAVADFDAAGGRIFTLKLGGAARRPKLYFRDGAADEPGLALDVNALSADGSVTLAWWRPSHDGLLLAYGAALPSGDVELRVRETGSGLDLPDRISRCAEASVAWLPDRTGFYYTRASRQPGAPRSVLLHRIGSDPSRDIPLFQAGSPSDRPEVQASRDGRTLAMTLRREDGLCNVFVADARASEAGLSTAAASGLARCQVRIDAGVVYLLTDDKAPRGRILALRPGRRRWRELIAQGPFVLTDFAPTRAGLLVASLERAEARLRLHDPRSGRALREIPLPGPGSVRLGVEPGAEDALFRHESFVQPPALFRYDLKTARSAAIDSGAGPEAGNFRVERAEISFADARLPLFLVSGRWRKRDAEAPTVLAACGGEFDATPRYEPGLAAWASAGGLWVVPALPGGEELGAAWRQAGRGEGQTRARDALLAAARWLAAEEHTRPGRLALLAGGAAAPAAVAAALSAPELFGTLVLRYPRLDEEPAPYRAALSGRRAPPLLTFSGPCRASPDPGDARRFTAAERAAKADALLLWRPCGGVGDVDLDADLDAESFLFWKLGAEKALEPKSGRPVEKPSPAEY